MSLTFLRRVSRVEHLRRRTGVLWLFVLCLCLPVRFELQAAEDIASVAAIESQIEQIKNDARLDELQKTQRIGQLQLALKRRDAALEQKRQAKSYADILTSAATQQKAYESKTAALKSSPLPNSIRRAPLAKLEALAAKNDAELATLRKQLAQITAEIKNEKAFDIQVALDEARQALQLQTVEPANEKQDEVARTLHQMTIFLQQSQIENLEQRLLSRNARLALWESQQKWLAKQIALLETRLGQIRALVTNHRQSEANKVMAEVTAYLTTLEGQPQPIRELAQKNIALAEELNKLVSDQDDVIDKKETATLGAQKIQQKYTSLTEQLAITQLGSSPEFGAALRKQRDQLIDESKALRSLRLQKQALTQSRLAQFRIDGLREVDSTTEMSQILTELSRGSPLEITQAQQQIIQTILNTRETILDKLSTAYWNYIGNLTSLTIQSSSLIELNKQYAELLDQQLLWMPSSPVVSAGVFTSLDDALNWLINPISWQELFASFLLKIQEFGVIVGMIMLALLFLVRRRKQMIQSIVNMTDRVGRVSRDKMSLTFVAFSMSFFLALPGPLALLTVAYLLDSVNNFSSALRDAIHYGAMVYLILNIVLQSARQNGLLELHLNWNPQRVAALRKNLPWFILLLVPTIMLNALIEENASDEIRNSLGRFIFTLETAAIAFFFHQFFPRPRAALKNIHLKKSPTLSEWIYRYVRFSLIVLLPLLLVGISYYGYHYSAVQLENHLLNSALVILIGVFSFSMSLRAFAINERQLALEKLRARRAAAAKTLSEEESGSAEESAPSAVDLQEIDLQSISKQTNTLLKLLFIVIVGIALWRVWSEIFPAFKPLVNVELWQVQEMHDGVLDNISITLWDLLLSLAALVITYLSARNISGLLDAALLSRVSLEPGTSYAIATVAQYAIVVIGTVVALQGLGAQWSKLQWLIAALSVGLGFGLQEMVANFVSGIVILFERPFRIGDTVTVGEQWGAVTRIRMRATTIIDWDRREIIVPNKTFVQERLTNWTLTDAITRRKINVGVAYGSDVELVEKLLLKIAAENSRVLDEPAPEALFMSFGESCLDFSLRVFVKGHREHAGVAHELHKAIDREFRAHGIVIAFPQRDVHFDPGPITVNLLKAKKTDDKASE